MALCMLPYASSELLHRLSSTQHLSSRSFSFSVLAKYRQEGSTSSEGRSDTQLGVSIDHVKLPSKEPCCRNTPLVILPKKPYRRSSRLRVRKGRQYEVKVETDPVDMEAEEWVNRVLANNAMVEIDPMTVAEQISAEKLASKGIQVASLSTSSSVPDYFPQSNSGFPRISYAMAIAAGSAVVLAILAVLLQLGRKREAASASEVFNQSDNLEDAELKGAFAGERVIKTMQKKTPAAAPGGDGGGPRLPHREIIKADKKFQPDGDEVANIRLQGATSAAAAILTTFDLQPNTLRSVPDYSSIPLPPSISKAGFQTDTPPQKASSQNMATPSKNDASASKPIPTSKYGSVTPFFPSDRSPVSSNSQDISSAVEPVTPFFADEQGTKSYDTVTPFFADEVRQSSTSSLPDQQGKESEEAVTPFFADEVNLSAAKSSDAVGLSGANAQGTKSYKNVTPFFTDEVSQSNTSSASAASNFGDQQGEKSEEAVTPFFANEVNQTANSSDSVALSGANGQGARPHNTVTPFFPSDLSPVSKSSPSPSPLGKSSKYDSVTPFFPSDRPSVPKEQDLAESKEDITPFFPDEHNKKSGDNVTPFFPSDLSPVSKSSPSPLGKSSKYDSVTPFFPSDRPFVPKEQDLAESKKDITPFFPDEQNKKSDDNVTPFFPSDLSPVSKSNPSPSPLGKSSKYDSVTPFFPSDRPSVPKEHDLAESKKDITPFFPDEHNKKSGDNVTPFFPSDLSPVSKSSPSPLGESSKYDSVTPFFPSDRPSVPKEHDLAESKEDITPFFPDEHNKKSGDKVTPFFPSDLSPVSKSSPSPLGKSSKYDSVTPFFPSDRPSVPKEHDLAESTKDITPFFPDEHNKKSGDKVTPFFPSDLSPVSKSSPSPLGKSSKYDSVTPFFPSDRPSVPKEQDLAESKKDITPFFPDEQNKKSGDNVTPFFPSDLSPVSKSSPSPLGKSSKYDSVTPFFPSDRPSVPKEQDLAESKKDITPFFPDEQNKKSDDNVTPFFPSDLSPASNASPSPLHDLEVKDVTPFFADERNSKSYDNVTPFFADEANGADSGELELDGQEEPSMPNEWSPEELALRAEEERVTAKYRALQAAFPALAIGAGAVGALAGVDGAFQMVGLTATASFISYELLWANSRKTLVEELNKITDHKALFKFLQKRKIVKEC